MNNNERVRVLVADDEPLSLGLAVQTIGLDPRLEVVRSCADGSEALQALEAGGIDVALLDIRMPGIDGLTLAKIQARRAEGAEIVFATAYGEHALQAFELGVCDYVTKPYEPERLRRAVLRAASQRRLKQNGANVRPLDRLLVRSRLGTQLVEFDQIEAVDADEKEVWLRVGTRRLRYSSTISAMELVLPCPPFVRVHRSFIVNLDHIAAWNDASNGTCSLVLSAGGEIPISRRYRRRLSSLFLGAR
jgi:two-component system LytT family response regulator